VASNTGDQANFDGVALVDVELEPGATRRDHLDGEDLFAGGLVQRPVEVHARGADQLGDHDSLGAIDDEGALARHHREITHEDGLGLDLARFGVHELGRDEQRCRVGHVLVAALLFVRLDVVEPGIHERQGQVSREIFDRGDLFQDLVETAGGRLGLPILPGLRANEPLEGLGLQSEKIWYLQRLA